MNPDSAVAFATVIVVVVAVVQNIVANYDEQITPLHPLLLRQARDCEEKHQRAKEVSCNGGAALKVGKMATL